MAFPKTERFKDTGSGHVPPVGSYDLKLLNSSHGAATFDRTTRFHSGSDEVDSIADDSLSLATPVNRKSFKAPTPGHRPRLVKGPGEKRKPPPPGSSQARVVELEKEMKKLLAERNYLSKELTVSKQEVLKLDGKVQMTMREKSALQAQVASLQKENQSLSHGKNILQAKAANAVDARRTVALQNELSQATHQLQTNKKVLRKLNRELDTSTRRLRGDLDLTKATKAELEARVIELDEELELARETEDAQEQQLLELKGSYGELQGSHSGLQDDLSKAQQTCQEKDEQISDVSARLESVSEDRQRLEQLLGELESEKERQDKQLEEARDDISKKSRENDVVQERLRVADGECHVLREDQGRLKEELAIARTELRERGTELQRQQAENQEALESLTGKCLAFEEELAQEKQIGREKQAVLKSQLVTMEVSCKEQAKECKKWMEQYQSVHGQLTEQTAQNGNLKAQIEHMKTEHQQSEEMLKANLQQVLAIAEDLKTKETSRVSEREKVVQEKRDLQGRLELTTSQLREAREKTSSLERQLQGASDAVAEEKATMMKQELSRRLVETQKKLSLQEVQSVKMQDGLQSRIAELEEQVKRLREEKDRLQRAYDEIEMRYRPYHDQVTSLEDLNRLLESQTSLAQLEAQSLSEQYAKLLGHQNHKQKIQHVKKLKDENATLKQELAQLHAEVSKHRRTIKRLEEERPGQKPTSREGLPSRSKPLSSKN